MRNITSGYVLSPTCHYPHHLPVHLVLSHPPLHSITFPYIKNNSNLQVIKAQTQCHVFIISSEFCNEVQEHLFRKLKMNFSLRQFEYEDCLSVLSYLSAGT